MEKQKWIEAAITFADNINSIANQPHKDIIILSTANYNLARCEIRLKKINEAVIRLEENLEIARNLKNQQRIFRTNQELAISYLLQNNPTKCYKHLRDNVNFLNLANNAEKGHFFFYVALYYKKYNIRDYYQSFLEVSKQCFQLNETIRDFYCLKKDLDKEITRDKSLIFNTNKHLL